MYNVSTGDAVGVLIPSTPFSVVGCAIAPRTLKLAIFAIRPNRLPLLLLPTLSGKVDTAFDLNRFKLSS